MGNGGEKMKMTIFKKCVTASLAILMLGGCSTNYMVPVANSPSRIEHLTAASLKQKKRPYEVIGPVHCEKWKVVMYWMTETDMMRQTFFDFESEAARVQADAVVDVTSSAENHYQFALVILFVPFIYCHEETHVSGTAIKWLD